MTQEYVEISKRKYCVEKKRCCCDKCGNQFEEIIPLGFDLVCFESNMGAKVFLPTYGKNGYLELLKKIVPEWDEKNEISVGIAKTFEKRLNLYTPYRVEFYNRTKCPQCGSDRVFVEERIPIENYPIKWITINSCIL